MTVDEAARHRLFNKLEEVLGHEDAGTLMTSLPTFDLDHVATKRDLDATRVELRTEIERSKYEVIATLRADMASQTRTMIFALIGVVVSLSGLALFR